MADVDVRDELVRRFIRVRRKLALLYVHSREPLDDLIQVAYFGLLSAPERFDPGRGRTFTSYGFPATTSAGQRPCRRVDQRRNPRRAG